MVRETEFQGNGVNPVYLKKIGINRSIDAIIESCPLDRAAMTSLPDYLDFSFVSYLSLCYLR